MSKEVIIRKATEVEPIAAALVEQYHAHLASAHILYLFTNKETSHHGRIVCGKTTKLNPLQRFLSSGLASVNDGYDFLIVFDVTQWMAHGEPWRVALVDHELSHCDQTDEGEWAIAGHDLEEFAAIIRRHGIWSEDMAPMAAAFADAQQPALPGLEPATAAAR